MAKFKSDAQRKAVMAKYNEGRVPQSRHMMETQSEKYNGWTNWDTWAVNLHATNDYQFYHSSHVPWVKNIARKKKRGIYDRKQMVPAIKKYYIKPIIKTAKEDGDDIDINKVNAVEITEALEDEADDMIKYREV